MFGKHRRCVLSTALRDDQLAMWEVILALGPRIEVVDRRPLQALRLSGEWLAGVARRLDEAGLLTYDDGACSWLVTVRGRRGALDAALAEARAIGMGVPVLALHRGTHLPD